MSKLIIQIDGLGKRYRIGGEKERYLSLRDEIAKKLSPAHRRAEAQKQEFWALKDVSFAVEAGEAVGIIGRNGAGKSTLLKVLSQITPPTEGRITMRGRVASLLEVGTGFHPELTGRENVYLNGAILGMTRREIARKFDEIVAFAEIERFLDTPVKRYSSGMYVRLAFAVAAHLEPEILVIDEVLAVGDAQFQRKCLGKMGEVAKGGRTVLFVSHNMGAVEALCSSGVLIGAGRVVAQGRAADVILRYASTCEDTRGSLDTRPDRKGNGRVRFTRARIEDAGHGPLITAVCGEDVRVLLSYRSAEDLTGVAVAFNIRELAGEVLANCGSKDAGHDLRLPPGEGEIVCTIPRLQVRAGTYSCALFCAVDGEVADWVQDAFELRVVDGDFYGSGRLPDQGRVVIDHQWAVQSGEGRDRDAAASGGLACRAPLGGD